MADPTLWQEGVMLYKKSTSWLLFDYNPIPHLLQIFKLILIVFFKVNILLLQLEYLLNTYQKNYLLFTKLKNC